MVRIHYKDGRQMRRENDVRELTSLPNVLWVDLQSASQEEEDRIEKECDVSFQTPQEIVEIESSARFFEQNDAINANSNFLKVDEAGYQSYPISFILKKNLLFTYRRGDSKTFADAVRKMKVSSENLTSGADLFLLILETRIESDADILEAISRDITLLSKSLTANQKPSQDALLRINTLQEQTMMLRETIIDKQRVLSGVLRSWLFPEDRKEHLRIILKDIGSLLEYSTFNFERLEYLQDTFTGLINLEQNKIIKIFTVWTIAFLPPTLIAGIFGMNHEHIPFISSPYGFWGALGLMVASSVGVLLFFRRKGWI